MYLSCTILTLKSFDIYMRVFTKSHKKERKKELWKLLSEKDVATLAGVPRFGGKKGKSEDVRR